jgi:hypothetical protein
VLLRSRNSKKNEVTKPIVIYATMATKDEEIAMIGMTAGSISIMAPSDMPGGYEFFADAGNGSSYKVRVVRKQKKYIRFVVQGCWCLPDVCRMPICRLLFFGSSSSHLLMKFWLVMRCLVLDHSRPPPCNVWTLKSIGMIEVGRTKKRTTPNQYRPLTNTTSCFVALSFKICFLHA